jgi:hypothetical protein
MAEAEDRGEYAADDEDAERVTESAKKERGHGGRGSEHDSVTPQLRKRDGGDEQRGD